jgi:hypothetical protein
VHEDRATWHRRLHLSNMLGLGAWVFQHPVCPKHNLEGVLVAQFVWMGAQSFLSEGTPDIFITSVCCRAKDFER